MSSTLAEIEQTAQCSCGHDEPAQLIITGESFTHYRTGLSVTVTQRCYECKHCKDPFTGEQPFRFVTPALADVQTAELDAAWKAKYGVPYFPIQPLRKTQNE